MSPCFRMFSRAALLAGAGSLALVLSSWTVPVSRSGASVPQQDNNRYIGAAKCKNCHSAKDCGDQYGVWEKEKHPQAFELLGTAKAKEVGKKHGVDDPQTSPKCVECHVTAYGEPKEKLHRSFDPKLGVQCETCHGPGEKHLKARMADAAAIEEKGQKAPDFTVIPDAEIIKAPDAKTCQKCHNDKSPSYKPFCFHSRAEEIRHLNPKKPRTDQEKAALKECKCEAQCVCKKASEGGKCAPAPKGGDKEEKK